MSYTMKIILLIVVVLAAFAYIRLAPSKLDRWHVDPVGAPDPGHGGLKTSVAATLVAFDAVVQGAPRTQVLAGSVDAGHITYISRSKIFGFPDYITVKSTDDGIAILSRLRFGISDTGVNRKRLDDWLRRLDAIDH